MEHPKRSGIAGKDLTGRCAERVADSGTCAPRQNDTSQSPFPFARNGIKLARPSPETMRSAAVFDCVVTVKPSMTRCRHGALKGPHVIAQGEALGRATKHRMSPERAKSGSVHWTDLADRKSSRAMPPFQGGNRMGIGFPGLRPGLSHSAPSGPAAECVLNPMSWRLRGDDGVDSARRWRAWPGSVQRRALRQAQGPASTRPAFARDDVLSHGIHG